MAEKLLRVRQKMGKQEVGSYVVSKLDDICWALNLRGSDIQFNPVFFSYLVVTKEHTHLFSTQHDSPLRDYCTLHQVTLHPYSAFYPFLADMTLE